MNADVLFGLVALVIAASSLTITAIGLRRRTKTDDFDAERKALQAQINGLEDKTERMGKELDRCRRAREELKEDLTATRHENFQLMSRLYDLQEELRKK